VIIGKNEAFLIDFSQFFLDFRFLVLIKLNL